MSDRQIAALSAKLQGLSVEFQKVEGEMAEIIEARQRLDSQQSENELVLKEFASLKSHNTVYKLIGPSLVPQDANEAKANVEKRLEFIKNEIKRVEDQLKEAEKKASAKKSEIISLQQELQGHQGAGSSQAVKA